MPSRKQRRRREKERRHEYEYVYVDEAGEEVPVEPTELKPARERASDGKAKPQARSSRLQRRVPQPPSWSRVGKRGLIFFPFMFLTITLLGGKALTLQARLVQTLILMALFVPFSYAMDAMMYRAYLRRGGTPAAGNAAKRRGSLRR
jgi:hypothetical protein